MRLSGAALDGARSLIASRLGLDFLEARRADLERSVLQGWRASRLSSPEAYLAALSALPQENPEWSKLISLLTVGETYFFRDAGCFNALEREVLPALIEVRRAEGTRRLRIWSAACATGEEPYSVAILLDRLLPDRADWTITILATDINPSALETARHARYRQWSFRETPGQIREAYFHRPGGDTFELHPRIRRMVIFAPINLASGGYPNPLTNTTAMDLILCRNVLMYFTPRAQRAAVRGLQQALVLGGLLIVSPAEGSTDLFHPLVPANFSGAIFFRKEEGAAISHQATALSPEEVAISYPPSADRFERIAFGSESSAISAEQIAGSYPPSAIRGMPEAPDVPSPTEIPDASTSADVPSQPLTANLQSPAPRPQPLLDRARALADCGSFIQARSLCEAVVAENPLDPDAYLLLAAICQEEGEMEGALGALRRAIYLAQDSAAAHFLLGSLLLRQGEHRRGRRSMETVVELLGSLPRDEVVEGSGGLTAGRLLETAQLHLEAVDGEKDRRTREAVRKGRSFPRVEANPR